MKQLDATVVILTLNGEEFLDSLLAAVFDQKTLLQYEVLVIDSGSVDTTLEIVTKYPKVRLHQIPNKEFGHGRTRNLAVELAEGEFVLFLTQDAVPSHDHWLDSMLEPFSINPKVSCVLGKQIPRAHCFVTLKREVVQVFASFGDDASLSLQRKNKLTEQLGITNNFLSDVNSAVRATTMKEVSFKDVNYAEDQALAIDMLNKGFIKAYAPLGSVFHSHDYALRKYYRRKFDEYVGLRKTTGYTAQAGTQELLIGSLKATIKDWSFLIQDQDFSFTEKLHDFCLAPGYNIATRLAIRKAAHSLTDKAVRKHSLEAAMRQKNSDG
jgi:glycosyltransferase involved in cell wall biosynthesis